jgi:CheY-like chemotaxis protein
MSPRSSRILIVDDQPGDLLWLLDILRGRGYGYTLATNEKDARAHLKSVKDGSDSYALAIIDVGVATLPIEDLFLQDLDEQFFEDARDTGIRLCRYTRKDLGLSAKDLPIACLTVRDDDAVKEAMKELDIPLFNRAPNTADESIRLFLEKKLAPVS